MDDSVSVFDGTGMVDVSTVLLLLLSVVLAVVLQADDRFPPLFGIFHTFDDAIDIAVFKSSSTLSSEPCNRLTCAL